MRVGLFGGRVGVTAGVETSRVGVTAGVETGVRVVFGVGVMASIIVSARVKFRATEGYH